MKDRNIIFRLSAVSVIGNLLLSAFKLAAGLLGCSSAMVSDAVHSLSDVLTTVIAVIGVRISSRSADERHPYGHERFESVASLILGAILLGTGLMIGYSGVVSLIHYDPSTAAVPTLLPLIAAIVSIIVKEAMARYTLHWANRINSAAFRADAWHHRSDALSSAGSLIGIGAARLGLPFMDPLSGIVICLFILKASYDILRDSFNAMLDTSCSATFEKQAADFITAQPGVCRLDLLHTRQFGSKVYMDVEIAVRRNSSLLEAHGIAEAVHDAVEQKFTNVKHVMIHVNPMEA